MKPNNSQLNYVEINGFVLSKFNLIFRFLQNSLELRHNIHTKVTYQVKK